MSACGVATARLRPLADPQWLRVRHGGQAAFFLSQCGRWQVRNLLGGWTLYDRGIPVGTYETPGRAQLAAAAVE